MVNLHAHVVKGPTPIWYTALASSRRWSLMELDGEERFARADT
jgi:hypothetical protein